MENIKCITFNKEAQNKIPKYIRDKMNADRKKAEEKELLEKAFDAGWDCSVSHNCGSCDGAFYDFNEWYNSLNN